MDWGDYSKAFDELLAAKKKQDQLAEAVARNRMKRVLSDKGIKPRERHRQYSHIADLLGNTGLL